MPNSNDTLNQLIADIGGMGFKRDTGIMKSLLRDPITANERMYAALESLDNVESFQVVAEYSGREVVVGRRQTVAQALTLCDQCEEHESMPHGATFWVEVIADE